MSSLSRREIVAAGATLAASAPALAAGEASVRLEALLARLEAIDRAGPTLNSVIALDPSARSQAARLDASPRRSPLHGLCVLVKDNIDVASLPTTAGSLALVRNLAERDAPAVARLRAAGALIVGKANLSEWANIRGAPSLGGWSAVGGMTRNPHVLDRTADGSSSGSAVAVAAGLADVALGTETDGSIVDPASLNGVVGMKPSRGLIPAAGLIPVAASQDTVGAFAREVRLLAVALSAMGSTDLSAASRMDGLRGKRVGLARWTNPGPPVQALFAKACQVLEAQGAELVELEGFRPQTDLGEDELQVLLTEFRAGVDAYLKVRRADIPVRSLEAVVAFNLKSDDELALFGQSLFKAALTTGGLGDARYLQARERVRAGAASLEQLLSRHRLDLLTGPTNGVAPPIDPAFAAAKTSHSMSQLPAIAGWPHLTVPMGSVLELPVGLSVVGPIGKDSAVLAAGYAFEQATRHIKRPGLRTSLLAIPSVAHAMQRVEPNDPGRLR